ncbi:MAG: outer membrane chaperone Skp [Aequorivita sp.]|jgi:outer membrane protein|nr:outer membrane chaperone Skp [Aequorivita sp.]MAO48657.1 outer membrane chaperone Skp [Aequorivita sp.]MBF31704.1 outer membrane chaperone Skp [Aequorivita sp.]HAV53357.1 outer membrane chaperone Skp [Aequorivita sp.]HBL80947.1 outer membrane chaperone Skp [Aequorivita sp.]|tara:strand:- start:63833 stop:64348 length:516 start_codon:yes stop_codon:yes gene_type:complete
MKFLKIAVLLLSISAFAQSKVGAVDIDYILSKMPEMETVKTQMETYGAQLDLDLNKKVDEYKKLAEAYKKNEASLTPEEKKTKQTELIALDADIQKFQQNGAKLMEIKQQEYLSPLYKKIGEALDKVVKAQGYTQVMETTPELVYLDPNYDLTLPILSELGITITAEPEGE